MDLIGNAAGWVFWGEMLMCPSPGAGQGVQLGEGFLQGSLSPGTSLMKHGNPWIRRKDLSIGLLKMQCSISPACKEWSWAGTFTAAKAAGRRSLVMPLACLGWTQIWALQGKGLKFCPLPGVPSCVSMRLPFVWCVQINIFKNEIPRLFFYKFFLFFFLFFFL